MTFIYFQDFKQVLKSIIFDGPEHAYDFEIRKGGLLAWIKAIQLELFREMVNTGSLNLHLSNR